MGGYHHLVVWTPVLPTLCLACEEGTAIQPDEGNGDPHG